MKLGEQPDDQQPFGAKQFAQALFEERMAAPPPTIYLIPGYSGAGKTAFAKAFLPKE
jgi:tRNA A37 threonylcarbamoyladenosine biosynthesis protein TsaE